MHKAGSDIRAWRVERKLTATGLADLLARNGVLVSPQTVYSWERGKVARPKPMLALEQLNICNAGDWLVPAPVERLAAAG